MPEQLLRLEHVTRRITSEFYIKDIVLTIYKGEALALAGKNAAGKSTLAAVLNGFMPADSGKIWMDGKEVTVQSTQDAQKLGIVTLMQNNEGFPEMSVADNVLFGNPTYYVAKNIGTKRMYEICADCFAELGARINPMERFGTLSPAQKQMAAIARARLCNARLIIMDEPSSHLPQRECGALYEVVRRLCNAGVSVLYITHRLREILDICDRVAFVRRGELEAVRAVQGMTEMDLVEAIEGFRVESVYGEAPPKRGETLLEAQALRPPGMRGAGVSFTMRRGDVVAVLCGADARGMALCQALCGLERYTGELRILGKPTRLQNPLDADASRIVCAVDEKTEQTMRHYNSEGGKKTGRINRMAAGIHRVTEGMGKMFSGFAGMGRTHTEEYMTGGFRQRELMLRAMARDGDIYILADPSGGVDLQTRMSIYADIRRAQARGAGILCATSDAEEAHGLADTIVVLCENGEMISKNAKETSPEELKNLLNM